MHFVAPLSLLLLWSVSNVETASSGEEGLLQTALRTLNKGLQYMEDHISEINLDGAFGCRLVEDLFSSFLDSRPEIFEALGEDLTNELAMLSAKADRIAIGAKPHLKINEPKYYAAVGKLLDRSEVQMWYSSRVTRPSLREKPLPCSESIFNETFSDLCLMEILGSRKDKIERCHISNECIDLMTKPRQRGYMITHQVLYFELVEMRNCLGESQIRTIPRRLQDKLCTNVLRDAEEIANSGYPLNHRDLFMEQIGLCGLWGYRDFYNYDWLSNIIRWQLKSGCYGYKAQWHCTENLAEQKNREKREEKVLEDGCLSHKTTLALLALAANIKFSIEEIYASGRK